MDDKSDQAWIEAQLDDTKPKGDFTFELWLSTDAKHTVKVAGLWGS